jgi:hypothetical protein
MVKKILINLLIVSSLFIMVVFIGCGNNGHSEDAPVEATMTINPTEVKISDGTAPPSTLHREEYQIVVKDGNGLPLKNVELRVTFWLAVPDTFGLVQFIDGDTPVNSPLKATTDEDGSYILKLDFLSGGGLEYSGGIEVTSGSLFEAADFEVDAGDA